jgi:acetylornithine/N-succinyldiaminopimelate aminotransferase
MSELSKKVVDLYETHHFNMYRRFPVTLIRGAGCKVWDDDGREYIDALAGIAVNSVGHSHPNVVKAICEQAGKLIHISNIYYNVPQSTLAKLLTEISGLDRVYFTNSGLEANEGALKLARKYGKKQGKKGPVVSFENCFHGRSIGTIAMGKEKYQEGFGPMPEGFVQLPFNDVHALEQINDDTTAVFVEVIQGEGGIVPGSQDFLRKLGNLCKEKDIVLIVDEIQTGIGRTGKMFAFEHYGLKPDIVTVAKGLGGGVPIGAVLATEKLAGMFEPGDHGTTFGGNPLACAASLATITTILEENLIEAAARQGVYMRNALNVLASEIDEIKEVRGMGLMWGVDFIFPCREIAMEMMKRGVLVSCTNNTVIRIVPPLIISRRELDQVVETLAGAVETYINSL